MPLEVNSIPHQLERFGLFRQFESERPISTASLEATDPDCRTQKKKKKGNNISKVLRVVVDAY